MTDDEKEMFKVGAETAMKPFSNLIEKLFGGTFEEIGGMWKDGWAARRGIRQISLMKKVQAAIEEQAFEPQQIPDYIWVPCVSAALQQDDERLQQMWANLLATAANPSEQLVPPSFPKMLEELSTREATFLERLYFDLAKSQPSAVVEFESIVFTTPMDLGKLANLYLLENPVATFRVDLDNLLRLRLIEAEPGAIDRDEFLAGVPAPKEDNLLYRLSSLGRAFLVACDPAKKKVYNSLPE